MFLQASATAELAHDFIDLNTALITGIVTLAGVVVFLYKDKEALYKKLEAKNDLFINELRSSNEQLTNVCNSYNQFVNKMDKMIELLVESKK